MTISLDQYPLKKTKKLIFCYVQPFICSQLVLIENGMVVSELVLIYRYVHFNGHLDGTVIIIFEH